MQTIQLKKDFKNKPIFAKKSLGQNFLFDQNYVRKTIESLNLKPGETILEIGPGRGALTKQLIEHDVRVVAIELDKDLIAILNREFGERENFRLIEADALKVDFCEFVSEEKTQNKIVANLPYYISTAILQKIIRERDCFEEAVLMLQKEVVERITAAPGNRERGFLTVLVEAFADVEKLFDVPPTAFRPVPKIWSSIIKIKFKSSRLITPSLFDENLFWEMISASFAQKRKTILNNLKSAPTMLQNKISKIGNAQELFETANVDGRKRAEELTFEEWANLVKAFD